MRAPLAAPLLALCSLSALWAQASDPDAVGPAPRREIRREAIEWCDAWLPHMKDRDLPRVMLIGDSITRGYYSAVEAELKSQAYVARIATSKALGDPALLTELTAFLSQARFDVVHVNIGMHGWAYTEEEYRRHLPALFATIRQQSSGARIIWATTTPIRRDTPGGATNARIAARNEAAKGFVSRERIPINDLHALMLTHDDLHSDDIHFTAEGSRLMGVHVATEIRKLLPVR